jgi:hypothetical protein
VLSPCALCSHRELPLDLLGEINTAISTPLDLNS